VQEHESRLTRFDEAFVTLVDLAKASDERMDSQSATIALLAQGMETVVRRLAELAGAQTRMDTKLAELAEAQSHTDGRLNALIDIVDRMLGRGDQRNGQA
jgi:hypothetical protein